MTTLTLARQNNAWWLLGYLDGPVGPYESKAEAEKTRVRLERFERHEDKPGYVTVEKGSDDD